MESVMKKAVEAMLENHTGKALQNAAPAAEIAEIKYHSGALMLPDGMGIPAAVKLLMDRQQYLETKVTIQDKFDVFPWDGANAINEVLAKRFGWANSVPTPGFFGDNPPRLISVEVAPGVYRELPWGAFSIPGVSGRLNTSSSNKDGRIVFALVAEVLRKDEATIRSIFDDVREFLKKNSIYRGKAIKLRFNDDDGDALEMPEPKFLDVSKISEDMVIYSESVQNAVQTNLFTPIRRVQDCIDNDISVKRGVLLGGIYGTGKTLAATVASKIAVDAGITYLYVPRADELADAIEFAKMYQSPACVVFVEDIDRALAGDDRTVEMDDILNIIDGIDTKNCNIITVLTTNALEAINPAMLRPGRLDAVIDVTPPDAPAVERLLRLYGGSSIDPATDLTSAAKQLDGKIPAVIAEVVKRAKLVQLGLQKPGEKISLLSSEALLTAAQSMSAQLKLLEERSNPVREIVPPLEQAFAGVVQEAIKNAKRNIENIAEVADKNSSMVAAICDRLDVEH